MFAALLPVLAPILGDVIRRLVPDQGEQGRIEAELSIALMQRAQEIETAAADIVKTEAASEHWLTATWRPVVMLVLTSLIVARVPWAVSYSPLTVPQTVVVQCVAGSASYINY